jgi:hypothetical protein
MPTHKPDDKTSDDKGEADDDKPKLAVVHVELRDEADSTIDSITRLIAGQGGTVKSRSGRKLKVEVPAGTLRDPSSAQATFVAHMRSSPLVLDVDHG